MKLILFIFTSSYRDVQSEFWERIWIPGVLWSLQIPPISIVLLNFPLDERDQGQVCRLAPHFLLRQKSNVPVTASDTII